MEKLFCHFLSVCVHKIIQHFLFTDITIAKNKYDSGYSLVYFLFWVSLTNVLSFQRKILKNTEHYMISRFSYWIIQKDVTGGRGLPRMVTKSDKERDERRTPLSNFAEHLLIFLQSTSLYFCKHLSIFLQTTYLHVCRTTFSIFAENISAFCRKPLNISNRTPRSIFLRSSLSIFPVIIIQSSILNNFLQQFCRTPLSLFAKSLSLFLQKISKKNFFVRDSKFKVDTASDV